MAQTYNFNEVMDDLVSRFILNCPEEELSSFERLFFIIEQAQWYYDDFYREKDPNLPYLSAKEFARKLFDHYPPLRPYLQSVDDYFGDFVNYKMKVPTCGLIILNKDMDKVLLVKGFTRRSSWGFPKGKINKNEDPLDCAAREGVEEVGVNFREKLSEQNRLENTSGEQKVLLYIVQNVEETTNFSPKARKEISKIEWHSISDLPSNFGQLNEGSNKNYFLVVPFIGKLKGWIAAQKKISLFKKDKTQAHGYPITTITVKQSPSKSKASRNKAEGDSGKAKVTIDSKPKPPDASISRKNAPLLKDFTFDQTAVMQAFNGI